MSDSIPIGHVESTSMDSPRQYAAPDNLQARQRLWAQQGLGFDLVSWVLDLAGLVEGHSSRVLDVGCGNGSYLRVLRERDIEAVGCDLSTGMLTAAGRSETLVNGDVVSLPFTAATFDVVLAPHVLYHVADRSAAVLEMRRVLRPSGRCVVVTNGRDHLQPLRAAVESAVRVSTPNWEMTTPASSAFSLDNGEEQLRVGFRHVSCVRPEVFAPAVITDASIAADYVASVAGRYQTETSRPWRAVVEDVREFVAREIAASGTFVVRGDAGAFVCE